ncbi:MAG: major capsid protein V20 domain-containing protein, partial [Flavobacterium sp.]
VQTTAVFEGPQNTSFQQITPPTQNTLQPVYTIQTPSTSLGLNTLMYQQVGVTWTMTGTALTNFQTQQAIALRPWSLTRAMTSLVIQLNNCTVSTNPQLYWQQLSLLSNDFIDVTTVQGPTATTPDFSSSFSDIVGSIRSPFANDTDMQSSFQTGKPRTNCFTGFTYSADGTSLTITAVIYEPLIASPFNYSSDLQKSFYGLNTIIISPVFSALESSLCFAIPTGTTVTGLTAAFTSQTLLIEYVTPSPRLMQEINSRPLIYNYASINTYQSTIASISPGESVSFSTNSFQCSVVPRRFLVFVVPSFATTLNALAPIPDISLPISNVSVLFANRSGICSGQTPLQLWQMSNKAGLPMSWNQYNADPIFDSTGQVATYGGGFLVFDTANDLSAGPDFTPGMSVSNTFSLTGTATNKTNQTFTNCRVVVATITSGAVTIYNGEAISQLGDVNISEVHQALNSPGLSANVLKHDNLSSGYAGSSFWSGLKKVFNVA